MIEERMVCGTLAELEYDCDREGRVTFVVEYWRGGPDGDDEKVRRPFGTLREATRFLNRVAANKARAWSKTR